MAVLSTYDRRLDLAANTMGASTWQRLWRITLPLIRPGLIAAFLIAFVTSFEELTIAMRSEEHTSELQSLMRISYAVFCLKKKNTHNTHTSQCTQSNQQE